VDLALADRVHRNLMRLYAWIGQADGGAVECQREGLLVASRSSAQFLNTVSRERSDREPGALLARAKEFFSERDRAFVLYCWPGDPELERAAAAAGLEVVNEGYPEMVCHEPQPVPAADVRRVGSIEDAETYWAICETAYGSLGFPPGLFREAFDPGLLLAPESWACLGYQDGEPLACASLYTVDEVGFVGWVGSLPQARGRGLAAACTIAATNEAFAQGLALVSLQASAMGAPLYPRLGYERLFDYRLFGWTPA